MTRLEWWRARLLETAAAAVIAFVVIQLSQEVADRQRDLMPPSAWFVVNEIYVPDHVSGANPDMIYDREIRENFDAFWIAEMQRKTADGLWTTECTGDGVNEYDPEEVIPDNTVELTWFTQKVCKLPVGVYRVKVTYTMTRPGWPQKRVFALSNEFRVTDPASGAVPTLD